METTQKAVTKKKKTRFFETYISKVLKKVSEQNGITANSKQQLNSTLCHISRIIANNVISLTEVAKKKTVSEKEVINSLYLTLPKELAEKAVEQSRRAMDTFQTVDNIKGTSRQEKAGIIFPPSQTEKFLRNFGYSKVMITSSAPICLAGALEYLTEEILTQAIQYAVENKRVRVTIRDLEIGVRNHEQINTFFTKYNITFLGGGVKPFIHESLLTKKNRKKRVKKVQGKENEKKKHRFRPGTVSLREIKRFQKMSNCLTFAKFPFEKFVREIVAANHNGENTMKISKDVFIILQYFVEQRIVQLLRNANFAAIHAGRVKLMPIDIDFVKSITSGMVNPYQKMSNSENVNEDSAENEDEEHLDDEENEDVEEEGEDGDEEELVEEQE